MAISTPFGIASLIELVLIGCSIAIAKLHAYLIAENQPIVHWVWSLVFCAFVGLALFIFRLPWWFGLLQLIGHLPAFDWALDEFRGLSWRYTSPTTGSTIDQLFASWLPDIEIAAAILYLAAQIIFL